MPLLILFNETIEHGGLHSVVYCPLGAMWETACFNQERCPRCGEELRLDNCDKVRSQKVAQGAAHSRPQPDFNLKVISGASLVGINTTKVQEFLRGKMVINISNDRNLRTQQTKAREAIKTTYELRNFNSREDHVVVARAS